MAEFLVERYEPDGTATGLAAETERLAEAVLALQAEGVAIELRGCDFLPADDGVFARFLSDSDALVAAAYERAGVPYERILETLPLKGASR
jgi:hypothetical protein